MLVELSPGVDIGSLDRVEEKLGHTHSFNVDEMRLEEDFWCFESLSSQLDNPAIWKLGELKHGTMYISLIRLQVDRCS